MKAKRPQTACPRCGDAGQLVADRTIRAILKPGHAEGLLAVERRFCKTPTCSVLYYGPDGRVVEKSAAAVRVGAKETEDPIPLCYCFGFTREDVRRQVDQSGSSEIPARIAAEVRAGRCACDVKNPSGACCLGEVNSVVTQAREASSIHRSGRGTAEVEARLTVHHALQLVAAVGQNLAQGLDDDSQQSVEVAEPLWLGVPVASGRLRAGLDPVALGLHLCDAAGTSLASLSLGGQTLESGLSFLRDELERRGAPAASLSLPKHPADFPIHALGSGGVFPLGPSSHRAELTRLFSTTRGLLHSFRGLPTNPIRLWPHHFDLACTVKVGAVSVGLGFSPGDGSTGQPYWYATLWPRLEGALPPLRGDGGWHLQGWFGAELPIDRLRAEPTEGRTQVLAFYESALGAARAV